MYSSDDAEPAKSARRPSDGRDAPSGHADRALPGLRTRRRRVDAGVSATTSSQASALVSGSAQLGDQALEMGRFARWNDRSDHGIRPADRRPARPSRWALSIDEPLAREPDATAGAAGH
jgi:hypothetical protein